MATKPADGQLTIAEATRQTWKELGKEASGVDVAKAVKSKYGHDVPSSTASFARKAVFGRRRRAQRKQSAAASVSGLPTEMKSKTEVVQELLASGMDSPTEIVAAAQKLGVSVAPNHVSMIKGKFMKAGGKKKKVVRRTVSVVPKAVAAAALTGAALDLQLENAALKLALQAGSVQAAMQALGRLE